MKMRDGKTISTFVKTQKANRSTQLRNGYEDKAEKKKSLIGQE